MPRPRQISKDFVELATSGQEAGAATATATHREILTFLAVEAERGRTERRL